MYFCLTNRETLLDKKIGILGGGQLGKMMCQAGSKWNLNISCLEASSECPAAYACDKIELGSFKIHEDVHRFGQDKDVITIEIESVNLKALQDLEKEGKTVYPQARVIEIIQDKGLQKQFYKDHGLASSEFQLLDSAKEIKEEILAGNITLPFVQKLRQGGYDGKGVEVISSMTQLGDLLEGPSVIEDLVDIHKEISVIVARNIQGDIVAYPVVEMEFNAKANLVEFLAAPARITKEQAEQATALATSLIKELDMVGLLAVELFISKSGEILINEAAPRAHNSGHHTIESAHTSQYEQLLRAITGMPLGSTDNITPAVMINLLGAEDHTGPAIYKGFEDVLSISGVHVHLYGKAETKPFRKMGHITVLASNLEDAIEKANLVKEKISIIA